MRLAVRLLCSFIAICCLLPTSGHSESDTRIARVGFSQFPGYSFLGPSGVAEGYSIDMIRMLLQPQGYQLSFTPFQNPTEILRALERGEIDLTSLLVDTPERRVSGTFSDPVGSCRCALIENN
ncbi:transporter substrate-binding domain-containing protein [uncultured Roseobacter sp.]|uniref:transporter substrate-binding domain-containing protein n=1 Tax=uncultured Roseobacter sp. TaxID=114847 RepID=UPI0034554907